MYATNLFISARLRLDALPATIASVAAAAGESGERGIEKSSVMVRWVLR